MPYTVGLTGGIGSGKSTVERLFQGLGADIIDTDAISHTLTAANGLAISAIQTEFGIDILGPDGSLDRNAMRGLVFSNSDAKRKLEAILHPMIRSEADIQIRRSASAYIVLVVPLLIETGSCRDRVDRVLVVDCAEDEQVCRTMQRSKLSELEVRSIIAAQFDRKKRIKHADDIIVNNGKFVNLAPAVAVLDQRFRALASGLACKYLGQSQEFR